jgi:regulator of vacuolar morphogenesis
MPYTLSIPGTSLSEDPTPHTIYALSIRTPLRTTVLPKRYSDFVALNTALTNSVGTAPPVALPSKAWSVLGGWSNIRNIGGRTVNNPELTERRRQGLEEFVKSIEEGPDPRWRETTHWRGFLGFGVPSNPRITSKAGADKGSAQEEADLRNGPAMTAPAWLDMHTTLRVLLHDARSYLARRDAATTAAAQHEAATQAKKCLVRANTAILKLDDALNGLAEGRGGIDKIGEGEIRRRRDLLRRARKERQGLDGVLSAWTSRSGAGSSSAEPTPIGGQKDALFNGQSSRFGTSPAGSGSSTPGAFPAGTSPSKGPARSGRVLGGPAKETNRTRELDNQGVLQLQQQIMQEQDQDVEDLHKVVRRMRELGVAINEELEEQKPLLEILDQDVDRFVCLAFTRVYTNVAQSRSKDKHCQGQDKEDQLSMESPVLVCHADLEEYYERDTQVELHLCITFMACSISRINKWVNTLSSLDSSYINPCSLIRPRPSLPLISSSWPTFSCSLS